MKMPFGTKTAPPRLTSNSHYTILNILSTRYYLPNISLISPEKRSINSQDVALKLFTISNSRYKKKALDAPVFSEA